MSCLPWHQGREERWYKLDGLAAAVSIVAWLVAALRVEKQLGLADIATHTGLVMLAVALMAFRGHEDYRKWRNVAVVSLGRLATRASLGSARRCLHA
jgi:hypothetical protein